MWIILLSLLPAVLSVPLSDFFHIGMNCSNATTANYGLIEECTELLYSKDAINSMISLGNKPFPYFGETFYQIYINANGFISFCNEVDDYYPLTFPNSSLNIIAIFWSNIDITGSDGGNVFLRFSTNSTELYKANDEIRKARADMPYFRAEWILIVTWENVSYYSNGTKCNTFQMVLVTDEVDSFVINNYEDDGIHWSSVQPNGTGNGLDGIYAQAGFSDGSGVNYFVVPGLNASNVSSVFESNVGIPGKWIFRLTYPQEVLFKEVGSKIVLNCTPPNNTDVVRWLKNGTAVDQVNDGISVQQNMLVINNASVIHNSTYTCGVDYYGIFLRLQESHVFIACENDFSEAVLWVACVLDQTVTVPCSDIHPSFRHAVSVGRHCRANGTWTTVDLRNCTMYINSSPLVLSYFTLPINEYRQIAMELEVLNFTITTRQFSSLGIEFVAISVSFTLQNVTLSEEVVERNMSNIVQRIENVLLSINISISAIVENKHVQALAFQPSPNCLCNDDANIFRTVCTGPSIPPCLYNSTAPVCNRPTFVGDGSVCGLDSDSDGFPDVKLDCNESYCEADLCPTVHNRLNSRSACTSSGRFNYNSGCSQDRIWSITWPATDVGHTAIQKCPGGSEAEGLATRTCISIGNWSDPNVSLCRTIELLKLENEARILQDYIMRFINTRTIDLCRTFDPLRLTNFIGSVRDATDTTCPLLPNDLFSISNTIETIMNVMRMVHPRRVRRNLRLLTREQALNITEDIVNILNNLLDERHDISFQSVTELEDLREASVSERLLAVIERVGILVAINFDTNENGTVYMSRNFSHLVVEAVLPGEDDIMDRDGFKFHGNLETPRRILLPEIEIPMGAVRHRFMVEGRRIPIVNIFVVNLESRLRNDDGTRSVSAILSSQVSDTEEGSVEFGGERIKLTFDIGMLEGGSNPRCAFWNFTRDNQTGGFSEVQNGITAGGMLQCTSDHLTSFSVLVDATGDNTASSAALSVVSYVGCGISIASLTLTIIALIIFRKTFNQVRHFIHINLSTALLVGLVVFVAGIETAASSRAGCLTVAILLHYFFLAAFSWMLCEAVVLFVVLEHVYYRGFFKSWKFFMMLGWGLPVPVVTVSAAVSHEQYGLNDRCWISNESGAIWAFLGPMALIILINTVVYTMIIHQVFKTKHSSITAEKADVVDSVKTSLKAAIVLLPLLGLTWVFGILAVNEDTIVFAWIFTIINSLQGLFIFIFYVAKNRKVLSYIKKHYRSAGSKVYSPSRIGVLSASNDKTTTL